MSECSECGSAISLSAGVEEGEILNCPDCGAELEVRSLNPFKLELAPQEEEDWGE